jgi:hypothetical protein
LAFGLQLRKRTEKPVGVAEKVPVGKVGRVRGHLAGNKNELPVLISPFRRRRSTPGQRKCLLSCATKRFPTSANFESSLSVRDLMWSEKYRTPKSL